MSTLTEVNPQAYAVCKSHLYIKGEDGVLGHLRPWIEMAERDPRRFSAQRRVELFNTYGRTKIMLGIEGWEQLFEHSRKLQIQIDPANIRRTESYVLRANRLASGDMPGA